MGYDPQKVIDFYKLNAEKMAPLYQARSPIGTRKEIPFEGHKPVRVIVNYPRRTIGNDLYPVYINVHGGAFAEGDAVTMDSFCQKVADELGILVINLNYRLFPEAYFPYPVQELDAVYRYVKENVVKLKIDTSRIAAGGFSAGATIVFGHEVSLIQKGEEGYKCILGGYPMTSGRHEDVDNDSEYAAATNELSAAMDLAMGKWIDNSMCSSLHASNEIIQKIKGAVIVFCGKDSLGKMGRDFALRLVSNGVPCFVREFRNAYHGFIEVNRPDYFMPDERKTEEQLKYCKEAEQFLINGLSVLL
ncbi:MAG: alpha/beta hydrolase fold domain-containing protein [Bilifractor sp.]